MAAFLLSLHVRIKLCIKIVYYISQNLVLSDEKGEAFLSSGTIGE